ncbi:MAG: DUF3037 domain-containing protein [Actinomycetota bacterium]|nr:DUF3037 domain-containing protein [Actinomycetota bacterium]
MPGPERPFVYAVLRVVPSIERGERLNVGLALFCRQHDFLELRAEVDEERLAALAPGLDVGAVRTQLAALCRVVAGDPAGGPLATRPKSDRFGWLVAPRSTILQAGDVHAGLTADPAATLERLFASLVAR